MCWSARVSTREIQGRGEEEVEKAEVVRFRTCKIQNDRNGGLKLALRRMDQLNIDLGLLQETKIMYGVYRRESAGFHVVLLDTLRLHRRSVALFYKELLRFAVEADQEHGQKIIRFQLVMSG